MDLYATFLKASLTPRNLTFLGYIHGPICDLSQGISDTPKPYLFWVHPWTYNDATFLNQASLTPRNLTFLGHYLQTPVEGDGAQREGGRRQAGAEDGDVDYGVRGQQLHGRQRDGGRGPDGVAIVEDSRAWLGVRGGHVHVQDSAPHRHFLPATWDEDEYCCCGGGGRRRRRCRRGGGGGSENDHDVMMLLLKSTDPVTTTAGAAAASAAAAPPPPPPTPTTTTTI